MARIDSVAGKAVLTVGHVAGMIDMVALPLWIGVLIQHYGYGAPQAGLTVTAFLVAVVVASALLAPRFTRLSSSLMAGSGFSVAAAAFMGAALQPTAAESLGAMLALHAVAGLGAGAALSVTHGCIGRAANPHRLFAVVTMALGAFAVAVLALVPLAVAKLGAPMLFRVFAATLGLAAVVAFVGYPGAAERPARQLPIARPTPVALWFVVGAVICLTLNQSMVFSFVERIGADRGFGDERVRGVLIALGFVNLLPGALAALLQKRLSPVAVGLCGPVLQAALAWTLSNATSFAPYALATAVYVSIVIFTHTFLFGLLARLDGSGRAVAATPAMMMAGSCLGPAVGGAVVHGFGYASLGWVACGISSVAVLAMLQAARRLRPGEPATAPLPVAATEAAR